MSENLPGTSRTGGSGGQRGSLSLSVVVCCYTLERWPEIRDAVQSLLAQDHRPDEVILVSDHNDELLERARQEFPEVVCVPNAGAQGLSGARNTGVAVATGDVVGFLDDDASAEPGWARQMLAAYDSDQVLGVGGRIVPAWRAPRPAWVPEEFLWYVGCSYRGLPTQRTRVRNPIGANMSFRREAVLAVGGFDEGIGRSGQDGAGCEETDLSIRACAAVEGGHVLYEPRAVCHHVVTPERTTRAYFLRRCAAEGRSKALVARMNDTGSALSSERGYAVSVLPRGVVRGVVEALRGDRGGLQRSVAIVQGLAVTAVAYLRASVAHRS